MGERKLGRKTGVGERNRDRDKKREREGSRFVKIKNIKRKKSFIWMFLKTIHKMISNQKIKSKERDKSILEYVQCMYNNVHTYKVPGF